MFENHFLRQVFYGNDDEVEIIFAVVFDFGDGQLSPPAGTYSEEGGLSEVVPEPKDITKL
jgi:hypothetical protein